MTTYYCKCGRKVKKSTSADNTGNRDVQDCKGCPYLLDYGKYAYDEGKGYHLEVTGKECRMSKYIDYRTSYHGHADDKCSMNIMTMDFDFLRRVLSWIASNCKDGELSCSFSPETIRPTDYCNKGRLSVPIYCAQNKNGMAAKAALIDHFFTESRFRRDIDPESEKQLILDRIKACRDSKEKHMDNYIIAQRDENQRFYALKFDTFWFWHQNKWVVSDFAAQQYEKASRKDEHLSKAAWLSIGMFAIPMDDYEVPEDLVQSIQELKKNDAKNGARTTDIPQDGQEDDMAQDNGVSDSIQFARPGEVFRSEHGTLYKIEEKKINSARYWHTVQFVPSRCEWDAANSTVYDKLENAQREFEAWKRIEKLKPVLNADTAGNSGNPAETMDETIALSQNAAQTPSGDSSPSTSSGLACPAETAPAAQNPSGVEPASLAPFDTTGLDAQTVADLELAAREYANGKRMTEMGLRRMADGVAIAHDALCVTIATKCRNGGTGTFAKSEQSFGAWCDSIGLNRKAAERLLQVAALFDKSSPNEQKVLEELSPSLLYAAAKPSAPAELVQGVKDGDITSHKQYKELLAQLNAEKARADGMVEEINSRDAKINNLIAYSEEADRRTEKEEQKRKDLQRELEEERASNAGASALLADEQQRRQKADEARIAAEKRASEAEKSLEGARHVIDASKRRDEKARSEIEDLRSQLADLKSKPIEAPVVDAEELDRMAAEKADAIVEKRLAELAPGEDALRNAHDAVILAVRIIDSISQLLMPHMGVLDNDQIMEACETISRATSKLNGGLARCLKN